MTKETTYAPELRFPEFHDDWQVKNGDELFDSIVNKNHNSDLPILAITQEQGAVPREMIDYKIAVTDKSIESYKVVEIGDFIISLRSFQGGIEYSNYKGICSPAYIVLRKKSDDISNDFFKYYFKTKRYISELTKNLEGIRDGKMISYKQFSETKIFLPTLPEQRKIALCLSSLDNLIKAVGNKIELLKQHKKGLIQKLFPKRGSNVPELRFSGFEGEWEVKRLGDCGDTYTGLSGKTKEDFGHGDAEYVTYLNIFQNPIAKDIFNEKIEIDEKQYSVKYGDVFFTTSSETPDEVGMSSVWLYDKANVYLNSFCFGYRPKMSFNPLYLAFYFRSYYFRKKITVLAQGISRYNISKIKAMDLPLAFPALSEQQKIAACLSSIDIEIETYEQKLTKLQEHKKGLMQKMFVKIR